MASRFDTLTNIPSRFTTPIGTRNDGRPIYLMGGGSVQSFEAENQEQVTAPSVPAETQTQTRTFTVEDLEKARREEKEKVYSRLEQEAQQRKALEDQVQSLLAAQAEREAAEREARERAEAEARAKAEEEMSAKELLAQREREFNERIQQTQTEWEKKFEQIAQERAQERAILEKEKEMASLAAYAQQRVAEAKDEIAPQLLDFITGNSKEEIDASIERAKAKSAEIAAAIQENLVQQRAAQRGVSPTGYAPVGPMEMGDQTRQYSPEDIANMSLEEYAKFRQQAGIGGQSSSRGLFG